MWKRTDEAAEQLVPLTTLVGEHFGATVGELVDTLAGRGFAIDVDHAGRLAVAVPVATTLRQERAEQQRQAAQEAAEAAAAAAERAAKAAEVQAVEEAEARRRQGVRDRRHERIRRLEQATGQTIVALEIGLRRSLVNAPNTGMSYDDRQRPKMLPSRSTSWSASCWSGTASTPWRR
jgi:hypothetical protein